MQTPLLRRIRLLAIVPVVILLANAFTFCSRTVQCQAFNDSAVVHWFPYYQGQQLTFVTAAGAQEVMHIASVVNSNAYSEKVRNNAANFHCMAVDSVVSTETTGQRARLYINAVEYDTASQPKQVIIGLKGTYFSAAGFADTGLVTAYSSFHSDTLHNYTLPGHTWYQVQRISVTDTASLPPGVPYRLYIAVGNGIVGYELYPSHEVWGLQ